ncbi:P-loop containing nucleoside triphosphate hydrolase protein, partial [Pseudomassariella vexata]
MLLAAFTPASRSCWLPQRGFHASYPNFAKYRPMRQPLKVGAFTIPHSPALPISQVPLEQLLESPKHNGSLIDDLRTLFTKNPATFYHGTSDFYTLKKNTRVPEICVLGRSNVGKSTLVNAIANRREKELAHTSSKAGRTRAMNAFGFGPAPTMKELADTSTEVKRTEDLPKHSLFIVDMPGYGHRSLKDWGRNINLYLHKRQSVKGAVVLIDGEVGPKSTDLVALDLLCEAGVRTAIVLTKADKARDEAMLLNTCQELWNTLRDIQFKHLESGWQWEKDIFVTAVGATKKEVGADTVDVARLVIARLAGLVDEKVRPEQEAAKKYSGKIVSFDDLQY